MRQGRRCTCTHPDRQETEEGVIYCGLCEELIEEQPDLLPTIATSQVKILRALEQLTRDVALLGAGVVSDSPRPSAPPLLNTTETAAVLGRSRDWVRRHAVELSVVNLTNGPKPRRMFPRSKIEEIANGGAEPAPAPAGERTRRRRNGKGPDLLPIKGRAA